MYPILLILEVRYNDLDGLLAQLAFLLNVLFQDINVP